MVTQEKQRLLSDVVLHMLCAVTRLQELQDMLRQLKVLALLTSAPILLCYKALLLCHCMTSAHHGTLLPQDRNVLTVCWD